MRTLQLPPVQLESGAAVTPSAFVDSIVLAYHKHGLDPDNALRAAQVDRARLGDPTYRLTAGQMELVSAIAMQEMDDEALGWFSRKLPWGSYGMLCRASLTAPTLGVALKRWCRHHRLLTEDILLHLHCEGQQATLNVESRIELGAMQELCLVTSLRYALAYASWVVDSGIELRGSQFPYSAPAHVDAYEVLFPGPLEFDATMASVSFDRAYLDLPLRRDEEGLRQMLKRGLQMTVLQYRKDRLLVQRVRHILSEHCQAMPEVSDLAQRLHLSTRTLQRQLKEEGATLNALKEEVRRDKAIELLHKSSRSIKQIAATLGYQNEKSFSRSFKQWTGQSPQSHRQSESITGAHRLSHDPQAE